MYIECVEYAEYHNMHCYGLTSSTIYYVDYVVRKLVHQQPGFDHKNMSLRVTIPIVSGMNR